MPFVERLKSGVSSHFDLIAANPRLSRFFLNEVMSRPEHYNMFYSKIKDIAEMLLPNLQKQADEAAARGEIEAIDIRMLFISMVSLNVFPFITYSFFETLSDGMLQGLMADREGYIAARKAENIETIMRRIKKI